MDRSAALSLFAAAVLVVAGALSAAATDSSERHLVLVASSQYAAGKIPKPVLRRTYLGNALLQNHVTIRPLLNASDPLLYEVFLQKIMFMSHRSYERNSLSQVFRFGGTRPLRFEDFEELRLGLLEHPGAVSFMWRDTALRLDDIVIVMELWRGTID